MYELKLAGRPNTHNRTFSVIYHCDLHEVKKLQKGSP